MGWLSAFIYIFCIHNVSDICRSTFLNVIKESRIAVLEKPFCFWVKRFWFQSDVTLCYGLEELAGKRRLLIFKLHTIQYLLFTYQGLPEEMLASKWTWMSFSVKRTKNPSWLSQPRVPIPLCPHRYWQISSRRHTAYKYRPSA